jgi:hypothetical protein
MTQHNIELFLGCFEITIEVAGKKAVKIVVGIAGYFELPGRFRLSGRFR